LAERASRLRDVLRQTESTCLARIGRMPLTDESTQPFARASAACSGVSWRRQRALSPARELSRSTRSIWLLWSTSQSDWRDPIRGDADDGGQYSRKRTKQDTAEIQPDDTPAAYPTHTRVCGPSHGSLASVCSCVGAVFQPLQRARRASLMRNTTPLSYS